MKARFDDDFHVVVGASPHNLALACRIAHGGGRVLLVERQERIGGAWYVRDLFGVTNLEVGCHYIANEPPAYRLLNELGVRLPPMDVQPKVLVASPTGVSRINTLRNQALHAIGGVRRNRAFSKRLLSIITGVRTLNPGEIGTHPYRYPRGGCFELMTTLSERLEGLGASIRFGCEIESLEETNDSVRCHVAGDVIEADFVHLSRNQAVRVHGMENEAVAGREPRPKVVSEHVLLQVAGRKRVPFSVLFVEGDPRLGLVSDVGQWAGVEGALVIAVSVRPEGATEFVNGNVAAGTVTGRDSEEQGRLAQEILARLIRVGLLQSGASLSQHHFEYYELNTGEPNAWSSGRVHTYDSTDLAHSLGDLGRRLAQTPHPTPVQAWDTPSR